VEAKAKDAPTYVATGVPETDAMAGDALASLAKGPFSNIKTPKDKFDEA
jgi:hypothetical protein